VKGWVSRICGLETFVLDLQQNYHRWLVGCLFLRTCESAFYRQLRSLHKLQAYFAQVDVIIFVTTAREVDVTAGNFSNNCRGRLKCCVFFSSAGEAVSSVTTCRCRASILFSYLRKQQLGVTVKHSLGNYATQHVQMIQFCQAAVTARHLLQNTQVT